MTLAVDLPSPRQRIASLDGAWSFWPDLRAELPTGPGAPFVPATDRDRMLGPARSATVPAPWQAVFDDLRLWAGTAWYERSFPLEPRWRGRRIRLCFGAVDYFCSVWIDGVEAGEHEGGYLPFAVDVTDLVRFDRPNTVTLRVLDVGPGDEEPPFPFSRIPHGKQSWYGPIGGPWQDVWLEARGADLIEGARVQADPTTGRMRVALRGAETGRYRVRDPAGRQVARGIADPVFEAFVQDALPWSPERPSVYTLELASSDDTWSTTFGFREVGTRDGMVTVNGAPVYLRGVLDQDYWDGTIVTPPSDADIAREFALARDLGCNLLRAHIKPPTPGYLDAADRAGLLVWSEVPNWTTLDGAEERARDTLERLVERDANHPSLIAWSIVNEGWGVDVADAADRTWLAETFEAARDLDPSRLWVDCSPCAPMFHLRSDLNDFHVYRAVPEQLESWRAWTAAWSADGDRTYSRSGDAVRSGSEPRILSEFGIWGLPDAKAIGHRLGREPWWFDTNRAIAGDIVHATGVVERFDEWQLGDVFGSWEAFVRQSQEHQFEGLKEQIEDLRLHRPIAGYVITELADVHWEANGLLDSQRNPKAFHGRLPDVNADTIVVARPERRRYRSGQLAQLDVVVASPFPVADRSVRWEIGELGLAGTVDAPGRITFPVPALERPVAVSLSVRLGHGDGGATVTNATRLWLYPDRPGDRPRDVAIADSWSAVRDHVARGGRAVVIAAHDDAFPADGTVRLERWDPDDDLTGWNRSTGLGWLHPRVTDGLPIGPRVDLGMLGLTSDLRLRGYAPPERGDVLGGSFLGWIRDVTASIAAFRHGDGLGIACTFPLLDRDGDDPLATALLDRLAALVRDRTFTAVKTI